MKLRLDITGETDDSGPRALITEVIRSELAGEVSPALHARSRARLLEELSTADARPPRDLDATRRRTPKLFWPLLAAAALALAFVSGSLFGSRQRPILVAGPECASAAAVLPGARQAPTSSVSATAAASAVSRERARPTVSPPPATGPSLRELLERGEAGPVIERVEAQGVSGCLRSCSAADLEALADAARYRGRHDLSERALTAQRQRFPGSELAKTAAFLLGRAAQRRGDLAAAARYYQSYLEESPRGPLALEARGRGMQLARRTGDRARARALAREILDRDGTGVYAAQAREILSVP